MSRRHIFVSDRARNAVIEECATNLEKWYPDHAGINAYCASLRSMKHDATQHPLQHHSEVKP